MSKIDILYLCDNMRCANPCHVSECNHTHDIEHAKHKDSLDGRIFEYADMGENIGFIEVDSGLHKHKHKLERVSGKTIEELVELFAAGWTLRPPTKFSDLLSMLDLEE